MPTYPQLQAEVWWVREYQPPSLATLCRRLREFYGVGADALGSKGDNNHLYGYHRSAAWVHNSIYCTNRTYSVSETPGNRTPGDVNWLCAIDMTVPADQLIAACQRLDAAVRSGVLEKITEWYGNDDGDNRVDGYNNVRNVVASSDSSHLWHLHMSFDRGRANEDHSDLYDILTGADMTPEEHRIFMNVANVISGWTAGQNAVNQTFPDGSVKTVAIDGLYKATAALVNKTPVSGPVDLTPAALDAIEARVDKQLDELAD